MNRYQEELKSIKQDKDFIDLIDTNFSKLKPNITLKDILDDLSLYFNNRFYEPDPRGALKARKAIARMYKNRGLHFELQDILITASTSESYNLIFSALMKTGECVLLPRPTYPLFEYLASYARLNTEFYDIFQAGSRWVIDLKGLENTIKKKPVKALVLISPNNPTGMVINRQEFNYIIKLVRKYNILLIIDEVFWGYFHTGKDSLQLDEDSNILILNGISKLLALPDLKLAFILVSGKNKDLLLDSLETANDTYLNSSALIQQLLPALMIKGKEYRKKWQGQLETNFMLLKKLLDKDLGVEGILPEGGIHCVLNFPNLTWQNEEIALQLLREFKVGTHPGYYYDLPAQKPCLVISILNDTQIFKIGLSRIREFSIKYSKSH